MYTNKVNVKNISILLQWRKSQLNLISVCHRRYHSNLFLRFVIGLSIIVTLLDWSFVSNEFNPNLNKPKTMLTLHYVSLDLICKWTVYGIKCSMAPVDILYIIVHIVILSLI